MMYAGLTHGTAKMIEALGNEKQKKLYLKKLFSGEWAGTMLLTEPAAGSDVGALTTTATANPDGTYSIVGNKIFISGGEQDLTSNIVHPVLARIEGAPAGTSGISLFLVPKFWVNDDGSLGERNDVACTGIEEKMGIHGSATCSIALGSKGQCRGTLLGEANKGMRAMFMMMNEARFLVGNQGLSCASPAYMYAVNYARQRVQGRNILRFLDKSAPAVPIIQHPDIRRMLMNMKVYVESLRSLSYQSLSRPGHQWIVPTPGWPQGQSLHRGRQQEPQGAHLPSRERGGRRRSVGAASRANQEDQGNQVRR
jgi:alkylation response protein AidB-like acyl-CoA dehydrogenase